MAKVLFDSCRPGVLSSGLERKNQDLDTLIALELHMYYDHSSKRGLQVMVSCIRTRNRIKH